eukprot:TRINITY_DN54069_c1_g1_i10.p1 TRINITY_DN54069_c1_g1~~TRINITY_DN54069_c1_g1_i10.p1  ORF type:complete len:244 (+),score=29.34 TRINITY_DN54069_c1_g1_i10:121-852(+)
MRPGGYLVVSHPLGREWNVGLESTDVALHTLPDLEQWKRIIKDLPLQIIDYQDEPEYYCTILQVPEGYKMRKPLSLSGMVVEVFLKVYYRQTTDQVPEGYKMRKPLSLSGMVVEGFGRGSKQMGVHTANINPPETLEVPLGVYFGWAQLRTPGDNSVEKMVMNIGRRPTIDDGNTITAEAHIMHNYNRDFHGEVLDLLAVGFIRPEMKFNGIQELILRIQKDIAIARNQLNILDVPRSLSVEN